MSNSINPIQLEHDFDVDIATAHSRLTKVWRNRKWRWSDIVNRCAETRRTSETVGEYARMSRDEQSSVKDVGGFVGGYLAGGARKTTSVLYRSLVTLDIDYGRPEVWDDFTLNFGCAAMVYSTHKHTEENPRLRLVIPADRQMTPREYEPVCRYWTSQLGIEQFDHTTYQLARLFYWPSTSRDGVFFFDCQDGEPFSVDEILATYSNPMDASEWPMSSREGEVITRELRKAGDPTEKPGLIGAFCRAYTIEDAIEKFLPDVYERTATEGRYTYRGGTVAGGCVTYEGKYAYLHNETDPASMKLCNAFDLVRIHKFGLLDEGSRVTDITRLPSYARMQEFAAADHDVRVLLTNERMASARSDFDGIDAETDGSAEESDDWKKDLDYDKKGNIKATPKSLRAIMLNDPALKAVRYDLFSQRDVITVKNSPFTGTHAPDEVDDTSLSRMCGYLSEMYGVELSVNALTDKMLRPTAPERSYHAVRDFITLVKWDGVPRVDTMLIDYMGARDTPLNRAISRKWMAAAAGRGFDIDPITGEGIKFDSMLTLQGPQGCGKSTFIEILAGAFRGSISLSDPKKEQYEQMQRAWIVEVPELKGLRMAEMSAVKDLISSRSDNFRAAYARTLTKNPRHCVLIASTNDEYFLKDITGNRRFWVVEVTGNGGPRVWAKRLIEEAPQLRAEAYEIYKAGEPLMLDADMERQMCAYVEGFNELMGDPLRDYLDEWLSIPLPVDWARYEPSRRKAYFRDYDPLTPGGSVVRERVAICEIVTECPFPGLSKYSPQRVGAILKSLGWEKSERRERVAQYTGADGRKAKATMYVKLQSVSEDEI